MVRDVESAPIAEAPYGLVESRDATSVLIVDADGELRAQMARFLEAHGFRVCEADSGPAARLVLSGQGVDVVILDVIVPGEDGLSIARELSLRQDLSVIMVSSLASELDRIVGLEAGADDYLAKPVSLRELLARIRAVRRRNGRSERQGSEQIFRYSFAGWRFDVERRVLSDLGGLSVGLSEGEFALLRALVERPQRVLTRDQLLDAARGTDSDSYDRAIDTQICRLRRKLGSQSRDDLIRTIRGEGYMFVPRVDFG
ncbi:MAG: response regulator transcription factor [Porphyrobacter sp.]|nr:response regulator transcription factor [Porphyrobacter sp.]